MPVTQIETEDVGSKKVLLRFYQHDCSLGEMADRFQKEIMVSVTQRMTEGKERFNWHDVTGDAVAAMEKAGVTREVQWQILGAASSIPLEVIVAIRRYNANPKPASLVMGKPVPDSLEGLPRLDDDKPKD